MEYVDADVFMTEEKPQELKPSIPWILKISQQHVFGLFLDYLLCETLLSVARDCRSWCSLFRVYSVRKRWEFCDQ